MDLIQRSAKSLVLFIDLNGLYSLTQQRKNGVDPVLILTSFTFH